MYSRLGKSVRSFGHEGKKVSLSSPLTSDGVIMSLARQYSGLDAQAELQNAEVEIKRLMAKPRVFASFPGMPQ